LTGIVVVTMIELLIELALLTVSLLLLTVPLKDYDVIDCIIDSDIANIIDCSPKDGTAVVEENTEEETFVVLIIQIQLMI